MYFLGIRALFAPMASRFKYFFILIVLGCTSLLFSQQIEVDSTEIDLKSNPPLAIPLRYSGTFAELRPNHFHAGVDLKTMGREGLPVYAVADGFVRRINVAINSYGKAVYIDHPKTNKTSVYAHLTQFSPKIQNFVKSQQYLSESYEIRRYLKAEDIPIKKGEIIGYSGNTGNSFGPHLHFEIRDLNSEDPLNPLKFGLTAEDNEPPSILGLYLFESESATVFSATQNRSRIALNALEGTINYKAIDTIETQAYFGFGIDAFDRLSLSANKNGWYSVALLKNDSLISAIKTDRFSFKESAKINELIDYSFLKTSKKNVLLLNKELIKASDTPENWKLIVSDYASNSSTIEWTTMPAKEKKRLREATVNKLLDTLIANAYLNAKIIALPGSLIASEKLSVELKRDTLIIEPENQLIRKPILTKLSYTNPQAERQFYPYRFLAKLSEKKELQFIRKMTSDTLEASLKSLGRYVIGTDSIPPLITPRNFTSGQAINGYRFLEINGIDHETGILSYNGYLDGQWVLFEYEPKKNLFTFDTNDVLLVPGTHRLVFEAEDFLGNRSQTIYNLTIN